MSDLLWRESYALGCAASRDNLPKSANPYKTYNSEQRLRYAAWRRGWVDTEYKKIMEMQNRTIKKGF